MDAPNERDRPEPFVHAAALCESQNVGAGTRLWPFAHVMRGSVVGRHCNVCEHVFVETGARIGDRVTLKNHVLVWDGVTIEDDVFVGPGVIFTNDRYPRSPRMDCVVQRYADPAQWRLPTMVRRGASLGAGAIILAGLTVGRYALVAAAAVVTADVADHALVMGSPARPAGWVCSCGKPLNAKLSCPECGAEFERNGQLLRPIPGHPAHV